MWFKNLFVYRLPDDFAITAAALEEKLAQKPLLPCGGLDKQSRGWVPCRADGSLAHAAGPHWLFQLGIEQKLLPASIIQRFVKERAAEVEAQQGYKPGRKQLKELKEAVTEELLPRAFAAQRSTHAWIDHEHGRLAIDAASSGRADELLEQLGKTVEDLPLRLLRTKLDPVAAMTGWLASGEAPAGFTLDRDLVLQSPDAHGASVRYAKHTLEGEEIRAHIASGKRAIRLGMTWNDRISFVLTEQLQLKRLEFLDIIKEESGREPENAEEQFELDFTLMSGELARLLTDLIVALDGEAGNGP